MPNAEATASRIRHIMGSMNQGKLSVGCLLATLFLTTFLLAGASLGQEPVAKSAPAAEAAKTGTLTGSVKFEGELPEVKELVVSAKSASGCCPPGEEVDRQDLSLVIGEDRGLQGVLVTVKVDGVKVKVPDKPYELDQKGCRFTPHMLVVPKGAKVAFLNSDETSHNVHLITVLNPDLNQTVLAGKRLERTYNEPERIKVTCDMHTWMKSWLVVTDATHWTITDEKGQFTLEGLPPGEHEVSLWHETLGSKTMKAVVGEDGTVAPLAVQMAKKKKKTRRRRR